MVESSANVSYVTDDMIDDVSDDASDSKSVGPFDDVIGNGLENCDSRRHDCNGIVVGRSVVPDGTRMNDADADGGRDDDNSSSENKSSSSYSSGGG